MKHTVRMMIMMLAVLCALCVLTACDGEQTQAQSSDWDFYKISIPEQGVKGAQGIKATQSFALTHADIPADHQGVAVTHIMPSAFVNKDMLQSVTFPATITYIGNMAFAGCSALTAIELPEGVTEIDMLAFANCTSLTEVKLPASLEKLGDYLFDGCTALTHVQYAGTMAQWEALSQQFPNWNQYTKHLIVVCSDGEIAEEAE